MQLLKAANQEGKLRLKARSALALVKSAQKGIFLRFHHPLRIQALRQNPRQRAFADAYGTFHCNVSGQLKEIGHGLGGLGVGWQNSGSGRCVQLRKKLTGTMQNGKSYNFPMLGAFACVAGLGAAVSAGYQATAPTGQWYGRTFTGLPRRSKQIALTYDDGPNDPHTLRLLEILSKHGVHATFFLMGRYVKQRPDIVREIAQAGHVIGNHTFHHPNLIFASAEQTRAELQQCTQVLRDAVGEHSRLFRPPFGGRRPRHSASSPQLSLATGHVERYRLGLETKAGRVRGT